MIEKWNIISRYRLWGLFLIMVGLLLTFPYRSIYAQNAVRKSFTQILTPHIHEISAQNFPSEWHPKIMQNGDIELHHPGQNMDARVSLGGLHITTNDGYSTRISGCFEFSFQRAASNFRYSN